MATNSFKIIGIKAVHPHIDELPENSPRHYEKVEAIQKVMDADTKKMSERSLEIIRNYTIEAMAEAHVRILSKL